VTSPAQFRYTAPVGGSRPPRFLVANPGEPGERRFVFYDTFEIGRSEPGRTEAPGILLIGDSTVSFRHCVVTQHAGGRCTVRDVSRNGTRVDGRRLVPNVETEVMAGQAIEVAPGLTLVLLGDSAPAIAEDTVEGGTVVAPGFTVATVLVGDIRDYTVMVQRAPSLELQRSVSRVFERLTAEVVRCGGTVKEYQGDAIFAFWEGPADGRQAVGACRAALVLNDLAGQIAADRRVWDVPGFSLGMEWALATGPVVIDSIGGANQRAGLSMVGEAVVKAFRLEKFATPETGSILACETTYQMALAHFEFRSLGEMQAKGFDRPDRVFALLGSQSPIDFTASRVVR
jgi:class 3 adenylate cyclase